MPWRKRGFIRATIAYGFVLIEKEQFLVRLPSGIVLGEAKVKILKVGPLHGFLKNGIGEPVWVENAVKDTGSEVSRSQDESPRIPER